MDRILFVIKDELPKAVVDDIYQPLSNLKHVRSLSDMVAFFLIVSARGSNMKVLIIIF